MVPEAEELEAILVGVVRKHKYLLSESYSSTRTRHIPDDVKREVWDRDAGRCVRCRASDYLEFDHIIPHTRGGANTVNNVQLLCRKCNVLKSDRI
jgi:5-methylcytosine-specific restriction endonuclease McrA